MKKLSLKNLKLESNELLERNQLKSVFGGYGGYSGGYSGGCGITYTYYYPNGNSYTNTVWTNTLTLSDVKDAAEWHMTNGANNANYCCASCNEATWL